jgi:hypothetical protein
VFVTRLIDVVAAAFAFDRLTSAAPAVSLAEQQRGRHRSTKIYLIDL